MPARHRRRSDAGRVGHESGPASLSGQWRRVPRGHAVDGTGPAASAGRWRRRGLGMDAPCGRRRRPQPDDVARMAWWWSLGAPRRPTAVPVGCTNIHVGQGVPNVPTRDRIRAHRMVDEGGAGVSLARLQPGAELRRMWSGHPVGKTWPARLPVWTLFQVGGGKCAD